MLAALTVLATGAAALLLLIRGGRSGITAGVLLLTGSLGAAGVLFGSEGYGPSVEGRLDLSTRLALGALGGTLGAALSVATGWLLARLGVMGALGVVVPPELASGRLGAQLLGGTMWGLIFGVLLPAVPGRGVLTRGALFSLLPTLWLLLKVFPVDRGLGLFGAELGVLTFVFVFFLELLWGLVTAWVVAWGERTDLAPLDGPLD